MPYVLVLLRPGVNADDEPLHAEAHERFIDSLIERNLVLLGGQAPLDARRSKGACPCQLVSEWTQ